MSNVHDLVQALRTVLSAERSTLIDLSALEYIDSRGLSVLEEYSGVFPVKLRPSPLVMRLLQVLKIADRFQIVEGAARK
jgi:anti-anti-sigma regulatory factor